MHGSTDVRRTSDRRAPATAIAHTPAEARASAGATAYPLEPVSAMSFDPYGNGQHEGNKLAPFAIDNKSVTAWSTGWYSSANFGNLKPGTGLLLDMGRAVLMDSVRLLLGSARGANLHVRIGTAAFSLSDLRPVVYANDAGGPVYLRLTKPTRGRYVLIWFTRLPPDTSGTFQASIYNISIEGRTLLSSIVQGRRSGKLGAAFGRVLTVAQFGQQCLLGVDGHATLVVAAGGAALL